MSRSIHRALLIAAVAACASFTSVAAQQRQEPHYKRDLPAALVKQAKVAEAAAAKTALKRVPSGEIQAVELENESGRLIYSYELKVKGHKGIEEVNVDAHSGAVVSVTHEAS